MAVTTVTMNFDQYCQATIGIISYLRTVHQKIEGLQADQRHLTRNAHPAPPQMPINVDEFMSKWEDEEPIPVAQTPRREPHNERPNDGNNNRTNNFSKPK